jgi:hypothetical protein
MPISMTRAFRDGFTAVGRNWGLAVLLLAVNFGLAALLAVPLVGVLAKDLHERPAAERMRDGFDLTWWERFHDERKGLGFTEAYGPEIEGAGFVFRNLDLLLRGHLPARLFDHGEKGGADALDPLIQGVGLLYLLVTVFLSGGVLSVLRRPQGGWKLRGLIHASGFYFGRLFRLALLTLVLYGVVFALYAPFARWADFRGREAVSETGALAWALGRRALLALLLAGVFVLSSYAKAIIVLEERASALLALLSALGFGLRRFGAVAGHALACFLALVALTLAWSAFDAHWATTGYRTQLVTLAGMQLYLLARIAVRLGFLGGALVLYRGEDAAV